MQAYAEAKARLFTELGPGAAVLNVDDAFGRSLAARVRSPLVRVSARVGAEADVVPLEARRSTRAGSRRRCATPGGELDLSSRLVGAHNLENLVVAMGVACALELELDRAADALSREPGAPGRLERCDREDDDLVVLVDYAHTPDALARVLDAVRAVARGRVWCVFGCGGDRDPTKRGPMGEAVGGRADVAVVTSDNPRTEDPEAIADAVVAGVRRGRQGARRRARPPEGDRLRGAFFGYGRRRAGRRQGARGLSDRGNREAPLRRPHRDPPGPRRAPSRAGGDGREAMATPIGANDAPLDARAVAASTGGHLVRATDGRRARGLTTDSRAVVPGGAFVALRGERFDGHAFVASAVEAGAALVVVERGRAPGDDPRADVVEVDDTLAAWGAIARDHVRAWRAAQPAARLVAITGSAGKTTTKELCAAILRAVGPCHATAGNLNNRVGVPAVVLQLTAAHAFAVIEAGMSVAGEIAALASIVAADVAVVTNVGLAHAAGVGGTIEDVAREKGALYAGVPEGGTCVANADDAAVVAQARAGLRGRRGSPSAARPAPTCACSSANRRPSTARGVVVARAGRSPPRSRCPFPARRPPSTSSPPSPPRRPPPAPSTTPSSPARSTSRSDRRAHARAPRRRRHRAGRRLQREPRQHARRPERPRRGRRRPPRRRPRRDEGARPAAEREHAALARRRRRAPAWRSSSRAAVRPTPRRGPPSAAGSRSCSRATPRTRPEWRRTWCGRVTSSS